MEANTSGNTHLALTDECKTRASRIRDRFLQRNPLAACLALGLNASEIVRHGGYFSHGFADRIAPRYPLIIPTSIKLIRKSNSSLGETNLSGHDLKHASTSSSNGHTGTWTPAAMRMILLASRIGMTATR